jgi:transcriptional regulator with XRE-family HTH domain
MKPLSKSEKKILEQMGAKFKVLRQKKGYKSYETFAFDNEINRMQYWRLEKGMANFSMATLLRILQVHKLSLGEFFKDFSE